MSKSQTKGKQVQVYAALGVGLVCFLGLGVWWETTKVYRVQLPYTEIADLAAGTLKYEVPFTVLVLDDSLDKVGLSTFGEELKNTMLNIEQHEWLQVSYRGNIRMPYVEETQALNTASDIESLDKGLYKLKLLNENGRYQIIVLKKDKRFNIGDGFIGKRRAAYINMEDDTSQLVKKISHIIRDLYVDEDKILKTYIQAKGVREVVSDKETMRALRSYPGYELTFTLLNPEPEVVMAQWDMETAENDYMGRVVKKFEEFADLTVKSQYLYYTGIGVSPKKSQDGEYFQLSFDQIPHIINPVEAFLASHVSVNPYLNFIVYVPPKDQTPLFILDTAGSISKSNSFLSPRWGGVLIQNMPLPENATLPHQADLNMRVVMETFISQLRLLLGITPTVSENGVTIEQPGNEAVADWELDSWLRQRCVENLAKAAATLQSLAQLLEQISNIVINDNIGKEVANAVESIKKSQSFLARGKLKDAFLNSKKALVSSETAFFDQSLLELLYFPEDQKFAIYIPLFLPVGLPVLASIFQAFKWIRKQRMEAKEKTE